LFVVLYLCIQIRMYICCAIIFSALQLYCDTCQRFLADRLVEGTCPVEGCTNKAARGDQCDNCSHMLNPTELIDPKCKVSISST
jgi:methionyl-tRNA synthetase